MARTGSAASIVLLFPSRVWRRAMRWLITLHIKHRMVLKRWEGHTNLLIQHNNEKTKRLGRQVTLGFVSCPPAAAAVMSLPPAGIKWWRQRWDEAAHTSQHEAPPPPHQIKLTGWIPVTAASPPPPPPPPPPHTHHVSLSLSRSLARSVCPSLRCVSSWLLPDSPGWKTTAVCRLFDSSSSSLPPSLLLLLLLLLLLPHCLPSLCLALSPCPDCCSFAPTSSPRSYCLKRESDRKRVTSTSPELHLDMMINNQTVLRLYSFSK